MIDLGNARRSALLDQGVSHWFNMMKKAYEAKGVMFPIGGIVGC